MSIQWIILRKICKEITKKEITLSIWTNLNNDIKACTDMHDNIIINGETITSLNNTIKAIAHEITHINHPKIAEKTKTFNQLWKQYYQTMAKLYIISIKNE